MRRWLARSLAVAALVALGIWFWTVLFPSPERVIRKRLAELAKVASFRNNESPLAALDNAQRVSGFFTAEVEIRVEVPGRSQQVLTGREEVFQSARMVRSALAGLQVEFLDPNVTVSSDRQSAEVNLTLKARVAGERDMIVQELKLRLNRTEGNWRIFRLETVKTLSANERKYQAHG